MKKMLNDFFLIVLLVILAFSEASTTIAHGAINGSLVNSNTLTIEGSNTVGPIAAEEALQWPTYWNSLVASNPSWDASECTSPVSLSDLTDGTAFPALIDGTADIGELSRLPYNSSGEWLAPSMSNMQLWAVGIDGIAIVLSFAMSWLPPALLANGVTGLTTSQVAQLFADTTATGTQTNQGWTGQTGSTALYVTWADFFAAQGWTVPAEYASLAQGTIQRAVVDPTSGTFDCFNNYFAVPNGYQFEYTSGTSSAVTGVQEMAPFTSCEENTNVLEAFHMGGYYIGFISLGYYLTYGAYFGLIGLNISYNVANAPSSTVSFCYPPIWGPYVAPTKDNVVYGLSGVQDSKATGQYFAGAYLWEVTPSIIPSSGPLLETGVWIAYMRETNTTGSVVNGVPQSDFVNDQNYIQLNPDDMAGATVIDAALQPHGIGQGLTAGQTQTIPDGKVNFQDIVYFVTAYIAYNTQGIYNPYADLNADGKINFNDLVLFVSDYIAFEQSQATNGS